MSDPAFPINEIDQRGNHYHSHLGMTMRHYLAGEAMKGMLANPNFDCSPLVEKQITFVVGDAYALADAMLEARK